MPERPGISLDEWYPIVRELVPTPVTHIIRSRVDLAGLTSSEPSEELVGAYEETVALVRKAGFVVGWPMFLRTGYTSSKHEWRNTCLVERPSDVGRHMSNLIDHSGAIDLFGLPCDVWAVRELLATTPVFHAFEGLPITRERRYYIDAGDVIGWHPYWPPEALESAQPSDPRWRQLLDSDVNKIFAQDEVDRLTLMSRKVAQAIPGAWSVDWLYVKGRGWFLTDMAWAERSWVWWDYPTAPKRERILPDEAKEALEARPESRAPRTRQAVVPPGTGEKPADRRARRVRKELPKPTRVRRADRDARKDEGAAGDVG